MPLTAASLGLPQIVLLFFDRYHDLIKVPFIGDEWAFTIKLIGILLSEFLALFPNRFIGHLNPPVQHHFFDISVAQGRGVVEPNTVANNFAGESMTEVNGSGSVNPVEPI